VLIIKEINLFVRNSEKQETAELEKITHLQIRYLLIPGSAKQNI
jgi:hypothetical protein